MKKLMTAILFTAAFVLMGAATTYAHCGSCGTDAHAEVKNVAAKEGCTAEMKAACTAEAKAACGAKSDCTAEMKAACGVSCAASKAAAKGGAASEIEAGYELGKRVPAFTLTDTKGKKHNLDDYRGKVTALVFYNQECPYVKEMEGRFADFTRKYKEKDVTVLAIDPGTNNSKDSIAKHAEGKPYPILINDKSDLARNFKAKRTPEVFLLNRDGVVVYHGAFDNGQWGSEEGQRRNYLVDAVDAVLAGNEPMVQTTKAFGCSIKFNPDTADMVKEISTEHKEASHKGHDDDSHEGHNH